MTDVLPSAKDLLLDEKFEEYLRVQNDIPFDDEDVYLSMKCKDLNILRSLLHGFDLPEYMVSTMIKFYIITEAETETLTQMGKEFGAYHPLTLLGIAIDKRSISGISWCMRNIDPDHEIQECFGKGIDNLDESDKVIIQDILEGLECDDDGENKKPSRKWWKSIVNYSSNWDDIVEDYCPFGQDTLSESSSSSFSSDAEAEDEEK